MADLRINGALPAAQPSQSGAPQANAAVRSAQRAFFQAALTSVAATAPTTASVAHPAAAPTRAAVQTTATEAPTRYMRPGSLLDIKV